jgi:hypothetical protein
MTITEQATSGATERTATILEDRAPQNRFSDSVASTPAPPEWCFAACLIARASLAQPISAMTLVATKPALRLLNIRHPQCARRDADALVRHDPGFVAPKTKTAAEFAPD